MKSFPQPWRFIITAMLWPVVLLFFGILAVNGRLMELSAARRYRQRATERT